MAKPLDPSTLASQFPTVPSPAQGTTSIGSPIASSDILTHEDRSAIGQLAADLLEDPIALQYLCDHVYALLKQDLAHQRNR